MTLSATHRVTASTNTGGQTNLVVSITAGSTIAVGDLAVLCCAYDNSGTNGADPYVGIVDTSGNTWSSVLNVLQDPGLANEGIVLRVFTSPITNALINGSNIAVSFGSTVTVARAWSLYSVASSTPTTHRAWPFFGNGNAAATANPTVTSATSPAVGDLVVGACAFEANTAPTADSDTTNGTWSTQQFSGVGTTTSAASISTQTKTQTTTQSTQTYNLTKTAVDRSIGILHIYEIPYTNAAAENAAATGAANASADQLDTNAAAGTATGTAAAASETVAPTVPLASATGTAHQPAATINPNVAAASGSGTAGDATVTTAAATDANAQPSSGTASANDPTLGLDTNAGTAAAVGNSSQPAGLLEPAATLATATGVAEDATASTESATDAPAALAEAQAVAYDATATGTGDTDASAAPATATGIAYDATIEQPAPPTTGGGTYRPRYPTDTGFREQIVAHTHAARAHGSAHDADTETESFPGLEELLLLALT